MLYPILILIPLASFLDAETSWFWVTALIILRETMRQLPAELHYRLVRQEVQTVQSCTEPLIFPEKMRRKQCKWDQQNIKFIKKKIKIFKNPNLLRVSEGLEDLSVQVVAAVDQIWVIVCQVGWRWRGWALPALKHAFQHRELHQV